MATPITPVIMSRLGMTVPIVSFGWVRLKPVRSGTSRRRPPAGNPGYRERGTRCRPGTAVADPRAIADEPGDARVAPTRDTTTGAGAVGFPKPRYGDLIMKSLHASRPVLWFLV